MIISKIDKMKETVLKMDKEAEKENGKKEEKKEDKKPEEKKEDKKEAPKDEKKPEEKPKDDNFTMSLRLFHLPMEKGPNDRGPPF